MTEGVLERRTWVPHPISQVFPFFAAPENLGRITPPELGFRIRSPLPIAMRSGALIEYTIRLYGLPLRWRTEITQWDPPHGFVDIQRRGPYAKWEHTHSFIEERGGTTIVDRVIYALPFGVLGRMAQPLVRRQLKRIFDYREASLQRAFVQPERNEVAGR